MRERPEIDEAREAVFRIVRMATAGGNHRPLAGPLQKGRTGRNELVDVNQVAREMLVLMRSEADRY